MPRGLFVTGADTNIGKTVVSAALLCRFRALAGLRYWKPVQTGIEQDDDSAEVRRLSDCPAEQVFDRGLRLRHPVSPHLAAKWSGVTIRLQEVTALLDGESASDRWIVEGAGGVLVPINDSEFMSDLMRLLGLPVLVVARSGLGTINHTLLTIEALRARALVVAGVVMAGDRNADNRAALESYGRVRVLGEMPRFPELTPALLSNWSAQLDPEGALLEFLQ
jgi:dethiobiotin synthetase/malonyl-CoA O-methyltransferase